MQLHRLETHDYRGYLHDILDYFFHTQEGEPGSTVFAYLRGVNQVLWLLHTHEGEPGSTFFITTYCGFPILNTTHIYRLSLLLYD